jgi:lysozyme family protein
MSEFFDYAVKKTLSFEGKFSNDPNDRGGKCNYGITEDTLKEAINKGIIENKEIENITVEDAINIYKVFYWNSIKLDQIKDMYVASEMFDTAVNMGTFSAIRITQRALKYLGENIDIDGEIGPITISLINKWCTKDRKILFIVMNCFQFIKYKEIIENDPTQQKFAYGWVKRIQQFPLEK